MPISSHHPLYEAALPKWQRCRDAYEGEDAVKARGQEYLPKPGGQDAEEYAAYVKRASYFEAVGRTVDGFVGAVSRKPAEIAVPASLNAFLRNATADGMTAAEFVKTLCHETLLIARCGVLVDFDQKQNRPYLALYTAENIVNWRDDEYVLHETVYDVDPADPFNQVAVQQYRQLHLVDGKYTVTLWRETKNTANGTSDWKALDPIVPTSRGKPLDRIPFFWLTPLGSTSRIEKPALLGLVNIALSHYRSSADLEHGRHFAGVPTLYITGRSTDEPIRIGATAAISIPDPNGSVGYAEFSGQGLKSLETALDQKEQQMAVLGAAIFHAPRKGIEAAETARIRTGSESSLLMGVVTAVEQTLTDALNCATEWSGAPSGSAKVRLNREFVDIALDPRTLQALVQAYQAGAITLETLLYSLQSAEMLPPDTDLVTEAAAARAAAAKRASAARNGPGASTPPVTPREQQGAGT